MQVWVPTSFRSEPLHSSAGFFCLIVKDDSELEGHSVSALISGLLHPTLVDKEIYKILCATAPQVYAPDLCSSQTEFEQLTMPLFVVRFCRTTADFL